MRNLSYLQWLNYLFSLGVVTYLWFVNDQLGIVAYLSLFTALETGDGNKSQALQETFALFITFALLHFRSLGLSDYHLSLAIFTVAFYMLHIRVEIKKAANFFIACLLMMFFYTSTFIHFDLLYANPQALAWGAMIAALFAGQKDNGVYLLPVVGLVVFCATGRINEIVVIAFASLLIEALADNPKRSSGAAALVALWVNPLHVWFLLSLTLFGLPQLKFISRESLLRAAFAFFLLAIFVGDINEIQKIILSIVVAKLFLSLKEVRAIYVKPV